ncbi:MAG: SPFH domain-containing protein [Planctomycetota bacterium]
MLLVGACLAIGPWFVPELGDFTKLILSGIGLLVLIVSGVAAVITKLYHKASANEAFVRTGMGGARVVKDGGTIVLPVVHQVIPVSLETMRLNVERRGPHALITKDNLRVDLSAEFYIKVQANGDDILNASRSLGDRSITPGSVSELVQEKLVSALRTVAATQELVELHSKRDEFAGKVQAIVTTDLASNGLTLESVTISALDQTDPSQLQERNVFDAQGLRKIAEITQRAKVQRNEIERQSEQEITLKDVATRKQVLDMQRDQAEFEAEQRTRVANVQAERKREQEAFRIEQEEAVSRRDIERQRAIEEAEVQRKLAVERAEVGKRVVLIEKLQEEETSEVAKQQAIEVAERRREAAIAAQEEERAAAQARALEAEAEKEAARQQVLTVEVKSQAERDAAQKLIAAQQVIDENRIREQTDAEVDAFRVIKKADAEKQSAEAQAAAKLRLAEADADAEKKRAEGDKAKRSVEVLIERDRVEVERERVEVERQELANRSEFEEAALNFEIDKLRIAADKDVRVAAAESLGHMLSKANMQIFGDPETMAKMSSRFMSAATVGNSADGFLRSLPPEAKKLVDRIQGKLADVLDDGDDEPAPSPEVNGTNGKSKS